jgi:mono/diheme cytochrome c family protein
MWKLALSLFLSQWASWAATGEALFQTHCAPCHGAKGSGGRGANLAVGRLPRAPDDAALAAIITNGIPGTQMPATRMTAEELAQLVTHVRSLGRAQAALVPGDRANGERLFWSTGNCGQCHTVGSRGGRLGPDLTEIGAKLRLAPSAARPTSELRCWIRKPKWRFWTVPGPGEKGHDTWSGDSWKQGAATT